jgi:hypothetical protein
MDDNIKTSSKFHIFQARTNKLRSLDTQKNFPYTWHGNENISFEYLQRNVNKTNTTQHNTAQSYVWPQAWSPKLFETLRLNFLLEHRLEARGSAVGWGTALRAGRSRVRFPMV